MLIPRALLLLLLLVLLHTLGFLGVVLGSALGSVYILGHVGMEHRVCVEKWKDQGLGGWLWK